MKFKPSTNTRINKALQETGLYSRRNADKLIESGRVFVDGRPVTLGRQVTVEDTIEIKGDSPTFRYALYYKPRGEITGTSDKEKLQGLYPIGNLDKESEGLLMYSNDPKLVDELLNPKNKIEKEYKVEVREKATPRVERILLDGITTQEGEYAPVAKIRTSEDGHTLFITLIEGKKHEIRRMLNALNLTIDSLTRIRIDKHRIMNMKPGQIRELDRELFKR
jgi:pseudouridine synthase